MDRIRYEFAVSDTVTPQLVGDDSSGFTTTRSGIDKLMPEHDKPPNVDSVMRPLRNSKT